MIKSRMPKIYMPVPLLPVDFIAGAGLAGVAVAAAYRKTDVISARL